LHDARAFWDVLGKSVKAFLCDGFSDLPLMGLLPKDSLDRLSAKRPFNPLEAIASPIAKQFLMPEIRLLNPSESATLDLI
jgi:hypothetical protein